MTGASMTSPRRLLIPALLCLLAWILLSAPIAPSPT